jgi:hypothetical protein
MGRDQGQAAPQLASTEEMSAKSTNPLIARDDLASSAPHPSRYNAPMHYEAHGPVIADLEARILTIRDSL